MLDRMAEILMGFGFVLIIFAVVLYMVEAKGKCGKSKTLVEQSIYEARMTWSSGNIGSRLYSSLPACEETVKASLTGHNRVIKATCIKHNLHN